MFSEECRIAGEGLKLCNDLCSHRGIEIAVGVRWNLDAALAQRVDVSKRHSLLRLYSSSMLHHLTPVVYFAGFCDSGFPAQMICSTSRVPPFRWLLAHTPRACCTQRQPSSSRLTFWDGVLVSYALLLSWTLRPQALSLPLRDSEATNSVPVLCYNSVKETPRLGTTNTQKS